MATSLKKLIEKQAQVRKEMQEFGKRALEEAFKAFFDEHPDCEAIRWRQYTPYFNDGDPCTFSVHEASVRMKGADENAGDYEDGFDSYSKWADENGRYGEMTRKAVKAWKAATTAADELVGCDQSLFETVFGDHVEVTATREGFEIEEYSHD